MGLMNFISGTSSAINIYDLTFKSIDTIFWYSIIYYQFIVISFAILYYKRAYHCLYLGNILPLLSSGVDMVQNKSRNTIPKTTTNEIHKKLKVAI
ncbi:hypothetical protein V1477_006734 [Vespula maculifrons]|uniref:Uncharacterized protein n=1 Tax=Vespula maculifrons TaxID=7453 RepID=A0ABD2CGI0_VESMC